MASLVRTRSFVLGRIFSSFRPVSVSAARKYSEIEAVTHTGQRFEDGDYRRARFIDKNKLVNTQFAIDLIAEDPVVVCEQRNVSSNSGGKLGHPKVFINLDQPGVHSCGYSGRKFVHKKYYDEKTMGPSITYGEYMKQMEDGDWQ